MRQFEWRSNGEVVATGYQDFDGSAVVTVIGMQPMGFFSVDAMVERFNALGADYVMNWVEG